MKAHVKTVLCLFLALAMTLSFAACGGGNAGKEAAPEAAEETEAEQMVYAAQFQTVKPDVENGLSPLAYTGDGFYAASWEKVGEREIPKDAVVRYEGEYDVYGAALYYVGMDGSARRLSGYAGMEIPEDTEDRMDFYGSNSLSRLFVNADGTLTSIETMFLTWYDGPESDRYGDEQWKYTKNEQHYYIRTLDKDGKELKCAEIEFDEPDSYLDTYNMVQLADGDIACSCETDLLIYAPDGTLRFSIEGNDYLDNVLLLKDGQLAVASWGAVGPELLPVEMEKKSYGEPIKLPNNGYGFLTGGGEYDLYYQDGMNLYGVKLGETSGTKLLNWINVNVNGNALNGVHINDDGSILGLLTEYSSDESHSELVKVELVPESSLPVKKTLRMAVLSLDYSVQQKIIEFNRNSETTRVEVQDYSEFNTEDDASAGLTKLTTELMAGNMPDLLGLEQLPYEQLAAKGLLEDLYPYLDADEELSREDFFPSVLKALEVNGGLYQVAPSFQIITLIGASSVVGDKPGWTYDEFNAALASMPAGCTPLDQYTTRDDILQRLVTMEMDQLVDWNTGECRFDSEDYIHILEFANRFQADFDWDSYEWSTEENTENRIAEGRQMLMAGNIYSLDDLLFNDLYFGGDATYIGYPTSTGVGNMMSITTGFAMSEKCSDKEAAWAFLRTVLGESYQKNIWGLPINRNAFNEKLKEIMTPEYQKDAEGNILLDEDGNRKQSSRGGIGMADGSVREVYAMTQEQADKLLELIDTTTRVLNNNDSLVKIVSEEAQAFFAGQKSAEEVARLTQSKINIYVNEQR